LDRWQGRKLYDARYAGQRQTVEKTPGLADDIALAADHLTDLVRYNRAPAALRLVLCEQAFALGMRHRNGYATAADAAEKLLQEHPELREEFLPKAIDAYYALYRAKKIKPAPAERLVELYVEQARSLAGEDQFDGASAALVKAHDVAVTLKLPRLDETLALRRYYQARRDLQKGSSDLKLRGDTILTIVRELDAPAEAGTLLVDELDQDLRTFVSLAAKPQKDVPEAACLGLGDWYLGLAEGASPRGKRICLKRAQGYLDRFFAAHRARDASGIKAELLLAQIDTQLAALDGAPAVVDTPKKKPAARAGDWIDLLADVDPKTHAISGKWSRQGEGIRHDAQVGGRKRPRIKAPRSLGESYEIEMAFTRHSGAGFVQLHLPVGSRRVLLVCHASGKSNLSAVKGRKWANVGAEKLVSGKPHTVHATVLVSAGKAQITVVLNGKNVINWKGSPSALSAGDLVSWSALKRSAGLMALSPTTFHTLRVRELQPGQGETP